MKSAIIIILTEAARTPILEIPRNELKKKERKSNSALIYPL